MHLLTSAWPTAHRTPAAFVVAASLLLAACGGSAPAAPAQPTPQPSPTTSGPTDFAAWIARQGFGGSSGLNEANKLILWIGDHPDQITVAMLDQEEIPAVRGLSTWLALHPPTNCWADYHATVSAGLRTLEDDLGKARSAVDAGEGLDAELAAAMADLSGDLEAIPAPADCP